MSDIVNSPAHYKEGGIESIDVLKSKLTPEEFKGFLKGNVIKYSLRANFKGSHNIDMMKAEWYLKKLNSILLTEEGEVK